MSGNRGVDLEAHYINTLRTQTKAVQASALPCPYCHGRMFQGADQLFRHAKEDHASNLRGIEDSQARAHLKNEAEKL